MRSLGSQTDLCAGEDDDVFEVRRLLLGERAVRPLVLQAALRRPPPVARIEHQRDHVPRNQHVNRVVLPTGHDQHRQNRCSGPDHVLRVINVSMLH